MQINLTTTQLVQAVNALRDKAAYLRKLSGEPHQISQYFRNEWQRSADEYDETARAIAEQSGMQL